MARLHVGATMGGLYPPRFHTVCSLYFTRPSGSVYFTRNRGLVMKFVFGAANKQSHIVVRISLDYTSQNIKKGF